MAKKNFSNEQKFLILKEISGRTKKNYEILTKREENREADVILNNLNSL